MFSMENVLSLCLFPINLCSIRKHDWRICLCRTNHNNMREDDLSLSPSLFLDMIFFCFLFLFTDEWSTTMNNSLRRTLRPTFPRRDDLSYDREKISKFQREISNGGKAKHESNCYLFAFFHICEKPFPMLYRSMVDLSRSIMIDKLGKAIFQIGSSIFDPLREHWLCQPGIADRANLVQLPIGRYQKILIQEENVYLFNEI